MARIAAFKPAAPCSNLTRILMSFDHFLQFSELYQNFEIFSMPPLLSANWGKHKIFCGESRGTKESLQFFSLLACNGKLMKMRFENQLFTMLKSVSEGSWVQTSNFPS